MLVHEHPGRYPTHVEAVEEVLHVLIGHRIHPKGLLVLNDALRHSGNHIVVSVPDVNERFCKSEEETVNCTKEAVQHFMHLHYRQTYVLL